MSFLTIQKYHTPSRRKHARARHMWLWLALFCIPIALIAGWLVMDYHQSPTQAAGIPGLMTYQGKVADSTGTAISNGNHNFLFQLYTTSSGGTPVWGESWTATTTAGAVSVVNGTFSVALGSGTSLSGVDFNNDTLYLEIHFDADTNGSFEETFSPRKRLTSAPYSLNSDKLDGLTSTDFLSTSTATTTNLYVSTFGINNEYITDLTGDGLTVSGGALSLDTSGVSASTYGDSGDVAQFTVDSYGRITSATEIAIDASSIVNGTLGVAYGGTGIGAIPSYGELLIGDGSGYTLTATSSLGIAIADTTGTLTVDRGGTGISTSPTYGQLLVGDGAGGYNLIATSSLGIVNDWSFDNNLLTPSTTVGTWFKGDVYASSSLTVQGTNFATTTIGSNTDYFEFGMINGLLPIIKSINGIGNIGLLNNEWFVVEDPTIGTNPIMGFVNSALNTFSITQFETSTGRVSSQIFGGSNPSFFFDLPSGGGASTVYVGGNGAGHDDTALAVTATTTDSTGFALQVFDNNESTPLLAVRNDGNVGIATSSPWARLSVDGQVAFQGENFATTTIGNRNTYLNFEKISLFGGFFDVPLIRGQSSLSTPGVGVSDALYLIDNTTGYPAINFVASTTLDSTELTYNVADDQLIFQGAVGGYRFVNDSVNTELKVNEADFSGGLFPSLTLPMLRGDTLSSSLGSLSSLGVNNNLLIVEDSTRDIDPALTFISADFGDTGNSAAINFSTSTGGFVFDSAATTTADQGFDISSGCYAINGTCISGSGGSSQWTTSGDDVFYVNVNGGGAGVLNDFTPTFILGKTNGSDFAGFTWSSSTDGLSFVGANGGYGFDAPIINSSSTATSTFAGNVQIASGKNLRVSDIIGYSPITIHTDLNVSGGLAIGNVLNCNSATQALQTDGSGNVSCATITAGGGSSSGGGWQWLLPNVVRLSTTTDMVGVGTTTPYAKLAVSSGAVGTTTLALAPVTNQTANVLDIYNTAGRLTSVFTSGGFLGVGTSSPYAMLSVAGETVARNFTATSTAVASTFPLASTTQLTVANNLYVGSLTGPLQAINGLVSATTSIGVLYGGTGLTTAPTYGQLLVGNASSGYTLTATSSLNIAVTDTTGVLTAAHGGTGQSSYTTGDLLYASGATALSKLTAVATGNALISGGAGAAPSWGKIALTTHVSGVLPIANGGTNNSSAYTSGSVVFSNGSSLTQDNTNLFWDDTNNRLGISSTTPYAKLSITNTGTGPSLLVEDSTSPDATPFIVSASGSVGVGTANPVGLLSVENNSADGASDFTKGLVFQDNTSGTGSWTHAGIWTVGAAGYNGNLLFGTDGDSSNNTSGITEKMRITAAGYVGIGDASPVSLFTVGSGDLFQVGSDGDLDKIKNVAYSWPSSNSSGVLSNDGSGNLSWATAGSSGGWTDSGTVIYPTTGTDQIAVGTTTAATNAQLTVGAQAGSDSILTINNTNGTSALRFNTSGGNAFGSLYKISTSDTSGSLDFWYLDAFQVAAFKHASCGFLCIEPAIGFGTTTPLSVLHLVQDSNSTGDSVLKLDNESTAGEPELKFAQGGTNRAYIRYEDTGDQLQVASEYGDMAFYTGTSGTEWQRLFIDESGGMVFNELGFSTADVRMEGDTNQNLFFLDASADKIGIGTSTPISTLSIQGSLCVRATGSCGTTDGTIYATTASISDIDLAENYQKFENDLTAGTIVALTHTNESSYPTGDESFGVRRARTDDAVIGIISTAPGLLLGKEIPNGVPVALSGRVPVKVNLEGGAISAGDSIQLSSVPGTGKKATADGPRVGIALENFDGSAGDSGTIMVFVNLGYYHAANSLSVSDNSNTTSSNNSITIINTPSSEYNLTSLSVTEAATFYGTITVMGEGLFTSKVVFENDVTISGHLELGKDTSGSAIIKEGEDKVLVTFEKPYLQAPRVVATSQGALDGRSYWITDKSENGFTIMVDTEVDSDTTFDWIALVNNDPIEDNSDTSTSSDPVIHTDNTPSSEAGSVTDNPTDSSPAVNDVNVENTTPESPSSGVVNESNTADNSDPTSSGNNESSGGIIDTIISPQ